jgi:hypothetical protein
VNRKHKKPEEKWEATSITQHPLWRRIWRYIRIGVSNGGQSRHPNIRIDVKPIHDQRLREEVANLTLACPACGEPFFPFRLSGPNMRAEYIDKGHGLHFGVTCPMTTNMACSRGKAARLASLKIKAAIREDLMTRKDRERLEAEEG